METITARITVFDNNGHPRRNDYTTAHSIKRVLTHVEWNHIITRNLEEWTYEISLYAQEKYNATKIVIEYHFEDGDITTETITTLEK